MRARLSARRWLQMAVALLAVALTLVAVATVASAQKRLGPAAASPAAVVVVSATMTTPTPQNASVYVQTVKCPAGMSALGGGARLIDASGRPTAGGGVLTGSSPVGNPPIGWSAAGTTNMVESGFNAGAGLTVYALCG